MKLVNSKKTQWFLQRTKEKRKHEIHSKCCKKHQNKFPLLVGQVKTGYKKTVEKKKEKENDLQKSYSLYSWNRKIIK